MFGGTMVASYRSSLKRSHRVALTNGYAQRAETRLKESKPSSYLAKDPDGAVVVGGARIVNVHGWQGLAVTGGQDGLVRGRRGSGNVVPARRLGSEEEERLASQGSSGQLHISGNIAIVSGRVRTR